MFEWKLFSLTKKCCRPALSCFQFRMNYLRHESKTRVFITIKRRRNKKRTMVEV